MAHSSDLDSSDAFMFEKETGYIGGSESDHSHPHSSNESIGNLTSNTPLHTSLPSDADTSVLTEVTSPLISEEEFVSDEELLLSDFEEEYSWEAIGGRDAHSLLYRDADVTVFQSYLLAFQYSLKHSLTQSALSDLLDLIKVHLPQDTSYLKSVYQMKGFFMRLFPHASPMIHDFCSYCLSALPPNELCATPNCSGTAKSQFITIPLIPQLRRMFEDKNMWLALQERLSKPMVSGSLRDVYDGELYQRHVDFVSQPANVTLLLNTDGVPVFRSSKATLWPVWLIVNELPRRLRFQRQNILLGGLWFAKAKPPMNMFLLPIMSEIRELHEKGIKVNSPVGVVTAHAMLLQCSADLLARASMTNMKSFNGKWGCLYCLCPGSTTPSDRLHRFWPYDPSGGVRSPESFRDDGKQALINADGDGVNGIKGPTVLSIQATLELPLAMVVDDLHCIYLGVTKLLLNLWFGKEFRTKDFSLRRKLALCDKKLLHIKVPDNVSRVPKSIEDGHWKGSEYRNWLLFYSLPVLKGLLPNPYLTHFSYLVRGIWILSSDEVTIESLSHARILLNKFYQKFHELYGEKRTTHNVHLISHLVDCVRSWGPLWAYTCFVFETMNGQLKKLFHGTRDMSKQMAFTYVAFQSLQSLPPVPDSPSPQVTKLMDALFGNKSHGNIQRLTENISAIGGSALISLSPSVIEAANVYLVQCGVGRLHSDARIQAFYRAKLGSCTYFSANYGRVRKRNSYTVSYRKAGLEQFGMIQFFFTIPHLSMPLVVIKRLEKIAVSSQDDFDLTDPSIGNIDHIIPVQETGELCVTELRCIERKVMYINFPGGFSDQYVCLFPTQWMHD